MIVSISLEEDEGDDDPNYEFIIWIILGFVVFVVVVWLTVALVKCRIALIRARAGE